MLPARRSTRFQVPSPGRLLLRSSLLCLLALSLLVAACGPTPAPTSMPPSPVPTPDLSTRSDGGGDPRSPAYWLLWNGCAPDNRAAIAAANGGRAAGWTLVDDLLADPGITVGPLPVTGCPQAVDLLSAHDEADAAYALAAQLLAARLNLAAGAEHCPAVQRALDDADRLLSDLAFDGSGTYLAPTAPGRDQAPPKALTAVALRDQLQTYNAGALCRP